MGSKLFLALVAGIVLTLVLIPVMVEAKNAIEAGRMVIGKDDSTALKLSIHPAADRTTITVCIEAETERDIRKAACVATLEGDDP